MDLDARARLYAALGDPARLAMVDALRMGDLTFRELADVAGVRGNLAAHHLDVLEAADVIIRRASEGDRRRRYLGLTHETLAELALPVALLPSTVLFVCTHNSARSQFAAARWMQQTSLAADSAGTKPAHVVNPMAVAAADEFGLDLRAAVPKGYGDVRLAPELIISVCDRAHEADLPGTAPNVHWSIPDPVLAGDLSAFRSAFASIAERIDALAGPAPT